MLRDSLRVKQGSTLQLNAFLAFKGNPINITGWLIKSQLRTVGGLLVLEFDVVILGQVENLGKYTMSGNTTGCVLGDHNFDILYQYNTTEGIAKTYTESSKITIIAPHTKL